MQTTRYRENDMAGFMVFEGEVGRPERHGGQLLVHLIDFRGDEVCDRTLIQPAVSLIYPGLVFVRKRKK
jgi:hypothetical protein